MYRKIVASIIGWRIPILNLLHSAKIHVHLFPGHQRNLLLFVSVEGKEIKSSPGASTTSFPGALTHQRMALVIKRLENTCTSITY